MHVDFQPCVYLLASHRNGTLYTGVTSNLTARLTQHLTGIARGFTSAYGVQRLVWFEVNDTMESAIHREKRIKKWRRVWKIALIEAANPNWRDLAVALGLEMVPSTRLSRHPRESGDPSPEAIARATKSGVGSPPAQG